MGIKPANYIPGATLPAFKSLSRQNGSTVLRVQLSVGLDLCGVHL